MQKLEDCEEVYEEEKWTEKEWLILVIAIGGGLSALCAGIIVCMCCMRKRYAVTFFFLNYFKIFFYNSVTFYNSDTLSTISYLILIFKSFSFSPSMLSNLN